MRKEGGIGDAKGHEDLGNEELQGQGRCKVAIIRETGKNAQRDTGQRRRWPQPQQEMLEDNVDCIPGDLEGLCKLLSSASPLQNSRHFTVLTAIQM